MFGTDSRRGGAVDLRKLTVVAAVAALLAGGQAALLVTAVGCPVAEAVGAAQARTAAAGLAGAPEMGEEIEVVAPRRAARQPAFGSPARSDRAPGAPAQALASSAIQPCTGER